MTAAPAAEPLKTTVASTDSDVVIETRNLGKTYRDFWGRRKVAALKGVGHRGQKR